MCAAPQLGVRRVFQMFSGLAIGAKLSAFIPGTRAFRWARSAKQSVCEGWSYRRPCLKVPSIGPSLSSGAYVLVMLGDTIKVFELFKNPRGHIAVRIAANEQVHMTIIRNNVLTIQIGAIVL